MGPCFQFVESYLQSQQQTRLFGDCQETQRTQLDVTQSQYQKLHLMTTDGQLELGLLHYLVISFKSLPYVCILRSFYFIRFSYYLPKKDRKQCAFYFQLTLPRFPSLYPFLFILASPHDSPVQAPYLSASIYSISLS